jgi:predicted nucleic acid-binding protein
MGGKIPIYCWDTSIWISWLVNENRPNNEMDGVMEVIEKVEKKQAIIITPALVDVEMLPCKFPPNVMDQFDKIFSKRNVQKKMVDNRVIQLSQDIRNWKPKISVGDVIQLATAIHYKADELHTFDGDDLLPLNGNVAGYPLVICKPKANQFRLPGF